MKASPVEVVQVPTAMRDAAHLLDRADLLLCLSRAFLPPPAAWSVCDWAQPLADDLAELGAALGLDIAAVQSALDAECGRWAAAARLADGSADSWLVEYARLFLTPPVPVPLNAGVYLEGALGGSSVQMVRSCYQAAGVEPDENFRDLPDHVSMQLEFLGRLYERAARGDADAAGMADEYCREFVDHWAGPFEAACRRASAKSSAAEVYAALVRLVRLAVGDRTLEASP
ncbi:TorD/DmsD family molecular chaperone [Azohydromonas sediminis]|uniref:TorD/DmsD family molecular chaperone n=1 Tax=Azohydromonas sediminis TaxID=2259674 RepID=UPI0013C357CB|nr:molecular chaperone TorD family protein [Azohydromonas sediminis]